MRKHGRVPDLRALGAAALAAGLTVAAVRAADLGLDAQAITRAISLGQTSVAADLRRFHQPYRVDVSRAPVDYLEVVTPFRRIVLAAQARAGAGDRRWGQRQAIEIEAAAARQIDLYAELTFHPLNSLVLVPLYRIRIVLPSGELMSPRNTSSLPRYGPRVDGGLVPFTPTPLPGGPVPGRSQPMLGATILASFDGDAIAAVCNRRCDVLIEEEGKSRVQVPLSLADLK
ncbi:MAG TPA: hypothetical protein VGQ37_17955 [Vicinamibacterales bacterium]|jgi:hypothetical protein|nr:hypothetical protein [Vicinamibacterales bacterium]